MSSSSGFGMDASSASPDQTQLSGVYDENPLGNIPRRPSSLYSEEQHIIESYHFIEYQHHGDSDQPYLQPMSDSCSTPNLDQQKQNPGISHQYSAKSGNTPVRRQDVSPPEYNDYFSFRSSMPSYWRASTADYSQRDVLDHKADIQAQSYQALLSSSPLESPSWRSTEQPHAPSFKTEQSHTRKGNEADLRPIPPPLTFRNSNLQDSRTSFFSSSSESDNEDTLSPKRTTVLSYFRQLTPRKTHHLVQDGRLSQVPDRSTPIDTSSIRTRSEAETGKQSNSRTFPQPLRSLRTSSGVISQDEGLPSRSPVSPRERAAQYVQRSGQLFRESFDKARVNLVKGKAQKRREALKQSIVLVGEVERRAGSQGDPWA